MWNNVLIIFGYVFLGWFVIIFISHIVIYIAFKYSNDAKYISVTRDSMFMLTENDWYIIPSISFHFEFKDRNYPSITITWLRWEFYIGYHFKTDIEEEAEAKARIKLNSKK